MEHDIRPWGQYWVLEDTPTHKVKRIEVNPGGRLSYQYHHKRAEAWTMVEGIGRITLDGEIKDYPAGETAIIPLGAKAERYWVISGLSDHTMGSTVSVVATCFGAKIIEKHFILDKSIGGPDASFSMDELEFTEMVKAVRQKKRL